MPISEVKKELKNNKGILWAYLSKKDCPACGNFSDVINKIKPNHEKYLNVLEYKIDNEDEFKLFPHLAYPMSYFYIYGKQEVPFIRQGFVPEDVINNEILLFKRVLDGEDVNEVFNQ